MAEAMLKFFDYDNLSNGQDIENEKRRLEPNVDYNMKENEAEQCEDVLINQSFPRQPIDSKLNRLIEYRIKLLSKRNVLLQPGERATVETNTIVNRKPGQLSLLIKPPESFATVFHFTEGLYNPQYRGRLSVVIQNGSNSVLHIGNSTLVGYLVLAPFLE